MMWDLTFCINWFGLQIEIFQEIAGDKTELKKHKVCFFTTLFLVFNYPNAFQVTFFFSYFLSRFFHAYIHTRSKIISVILPMSH